MDTPEQVAPLQTRDQLLASAVYARVESAQQAFQDGTLTNQYGSLAHRLPILIRTAGLAQALAYVAARGQKAEQRLLRDLDDVVARSAGEQVTLAVLSRTADLRTYMLLTQRSMDALVWFKRFAQTVLHVAAESEMEATSHD